MSVWSLVVVLSVAAGASLVMSLLGTALAIPLARRVRYVDHPGAHKSHVKVTPYGGGIAIFVAAWLPLTVLFALSWLLSVEWVAGTFGEEFGHYFGGLQEKRGQALIILIGGFLLHVMGIVDDVRPLGAKLKLTVMLVVALFVTGVGHVRAAEYAGEFNSIVLSTAWIVVVVNAFNFLDNMDGLSAGVAAICLAILAACGLLAGQVFVPGLACVFLGAIAGFWVFNFPPARIFMGDAGSLVVGYMMAVSTILTTYYQAEGTPPYALAMPLVIMAIPLYDFITVIAVRIAEGRHPMQGDQRHFSHRLVEHGLSRRFAVLTIYLATAATGLSATLLPGATLRETITILVFVLMVLAIIAILESPAKKPS
ncbi:MAG: undecaprenyl/decaprenyl-phosphate alpha-N-acetylglucosaminyl 1-phosphate transferase [Phycisphaerae bacterium]|nr:undecaprenyl/decaprenyl-phosphate alpha-N-acetylglucosaminyl 1-phosphate transferase [Phycisphaerae bacterium]